MKCRAFPASKVQRSPRAEGRGRQQRAQHQSHGNTHGQISFSPALRSVLPHHDDQPSRWASIRTFLDVVAMIRVRSRKAWAVAAGAAMMAGPATFGESGQAVRILSTGSKAGCAFIGFVSARASLGPDMPGQALKNALNQTAERGGDTFYLVTRHPDSVDGAAVAGEALKCVK